MMITKSEGTPMFTPADLMCLDNAKVVGRNPCCIITPDDLHIKHVERLSAQWKSFPRDSIIDVGSEGVMDFRRLRLLLEDGSDEVINVDKRYFDDIYFSLKKAF
jgi:hypothetical protein